MRLRDIPKSNYLLNKYYERTMARANPPTQNKPFSVLNMEITTKCNSNCSFCAHESLIKAGRRPNQNMSLDFAKKCIDWYHGSGADVLKFIPVGLGEPLLNPALPEILEYAKETWPKCQTFLNTNGIALHGSIAESLIDSNLDVMTMSLCFVEESDYLHNLRTGNYKIVNRNFRDFLIKKGDKRPSCKVHIFDRRENFPHMAKWVWRWSKHLNQNDHLSHYHFQEFRTDKKRNVEHWPCNEMAGEMVMIDVNGNAFPCCSALWMTEDNSSMLLANIEKDKPIDLRGKSKIFRNSLPNDVCQHCPSIGGVKVEKMMSYNSKKDDK